MTIKFYVDIGDDEININGCSLMKSKMFKLSLFVLLLSVTLKPMSLFAMEKDEGGLFAKGNRGFLLGKSKKDKKEKNSNVVAPNVPSVRASPDSSEPEGKSAGEYTSIWDDQQYQGAGSLNLIFSVLSEKTQALDARNLEHFPRMQADIVALLTNSLLSVEEFKMKLASFCFFHMFLKDFTAYALIYGSALPEHPNYLMHYIPVQNMDHHIISSILKKRPIANGLITQGSNSDQGQLVSGIQANSTLQVDFNYYAERIHGKKYYRLYLSGNSRYYCVELSNNHPLFKGYSLTSIMAHAPYPRETPESDILWEWSGFVLKKDGSLFEDDGIVLIPGIGGEDRNTLQAFKYGISLAIGQHRFKGITPARRKDELRLSPYLNLLVDLAGGFDKIKREKLAFLPYPLVDTAEPTPSQMTFLLPYLYDIQQQMLLIEDASHEELNAAIEYAEDIVAEAALAKEGSSRAVFEAQTQADVMVEINEGSPEITIEIDRRATDLDPSYKRPKGKQKWSKAHKVTRNTAIEQIRNDKAKIKMKERISAICKRHLADIDRGHYSAAETKRIRDALLEDLQSKNVITMTGGSVQHGSHAAVEVTANDRSTMLGMVERPQREGFKSGTVKRILNDCMSRVLTLFG